ncbi:hypothetical protein B0T19DRAFT_435566 [Cercophora scortea]|uniref:F-box domain-containing protein n=1 Tax=Cercophora scortea TaxID=314031 RepID=A0AAE0I570_9PEZI|nr:hypothetical protein B0T19DRAFT_435566 [Cercophora scortea]
MSLSPLTPHLGNPKHLRVLQPDKMEQQRDIAASDKAHLHLDKEGETPGSDDGLWYDAPAEPLPNVDQDLPSNALESHNDRKGKCKELVSPQVCRLVSLPTELINSILSYLCPADLVAVSATCHALRIHAHDDRLWRAFVQASVPGVRITSSYPCDSFRTLFQVHEPRWYLPRHKIWFSDGDLTGRLVIARYDQRRGCIEGYQLVAVSTRTAFQTWQADSNVIIHAFEPKVMLHLDKPVLQLSADNPAQQYHRSILSINLREPEGGSSESTHIPSSRFRPEIPMPLGSSDTVRSNFIHARIIPPLSPTELSSLSFPYNDIWPPPTIPAPHRVFSASPRVDRILGSFTTLAHAGSPNTTPADENGSNNNNNYLLSDDPAPRSRREMSDQTFRIRKWLEVRDITIPGIEAGSVGLHIGEEISTYATLDPALYTPTPTKPYRGIWVGDYSGHGCEFLLIHQPDDDDPLDADTTLVRGADETDESFAQRKADQTVYRGRLEAIKLTGDPNVPRGEFTFVVDDLGDDGFLEVVQDEPFKGARVVKSRGHIANTGFVNDMYIESRLILLSHDRLAQYWVEFGHISFFDRVDIDKFIVPG